MPEILGTPCRISLHELAFDLFEPKACVARAAVVFDPRHVLVPEISVRHGVLLRVTGATRRHASLIRSVIQTIARWITFLANFVRNTIQERSVLVTEAPPTGLAGARPRHGLWR